MSSDELTATVFGAIQSLSSTRKANLLLDAALGLISAGQYGPEVENYIEVFLKTPDLPKNDVVRALMARGNARQSGGETLIAKAEQDFRAILKLDPTNREIQQHLRREKVKIAFAHDPASHRAPAEVWECIASYIPRYHLRTWLSVSSFHRDVAVRLIFHTLDLYFAEDQPDALNRSLDVFDRVKADAVFASRVKTLRIHWAYEEGDTLDLLIRTFRSTIADFKALKTFEWIGYPEMRAEIVQTVLAAHPHLHGLGLIGWHFDAVGVSSFGSLRKFTLRAEDDDGEADMDEIRSVLDKNAATLRHLVLGAYLMRAHSWDSAFESVTIKTLTHLDLVDTRISQVVLARIAHAHGLRSLTLHGTFEDPIAAGVMFAGDCVDVDLRDGTHTHTFLPLLESFRFVLVGHDDQATLYRAVTQVLRSRPLLRRLDLGNCPWEMVLELLPTLPALRVLGVRISNLTAHAAAALVDAIPRALSALHLTTVVSDRSMHEYATHLAPLRLLSFLHLQNTSKRRPQPNLVSERDLLLQTDLWASTARSVAAALPTLDFLGWHGEHYVVVRPSSSPSEGVGGGPGAVLKEEGIGTDTGMGAFVELKELPCRRHLDCGSGVDLGGEDAAWLERKDVPMDYEMPVEA